VNVVDVTHQVELMNKVLITKTTFCGVSQDKAKREMVVLYIATHFIWRIAVRFTYQVCGYLLAQDADRCPQCRTKDPFGFTARKKRREKWLAIIVFGGAILNRLGFLYLGLLCRDATLSHRCRFLQSVDRNKGKITSNIMSLAR